MKHKPTKLYVFKVRVEGAGDFPTDMLRYDGCYPETSTDASCIDHSEYQRKRTVNLMMVSYNTNGPTVARWESFCWGVVKVEPV